MGTGTDHHAQEFAEHFDTSQHMAAGSAYLRIHAAAPCEAADGTAGAEDAAAGESPELPGFNPAGAWLEAEADDDPTDPTASDGAPDHQAWVGGHSCSPQR